MNETILTRIAELFGPLVRSNEMLVVLSVSIVFLLALLWLAPRVDLATMLGSASNPGNKLTGRVLYQFRKFRSSPEKFGTRVAQGLYRDGTKNTEIMVDGNDFLLLVRIVLAAIASALMAVMMIASGAEPYLLVMPGIAYLLPGVYAGMYNKGRKKKIEKDLALAASRIRTRIGAGARIAESFTKAAEGMEGPLWAELRWGARQIGDNTPYPIMRDLDARNKIIFFGPLADRAESAARLSSTEQQQVLVTTLDEFVSEAYVKSQEKLAKLSGRVTIVMMPFLLFGLLLAALSPVVINMINGNL